ncbi:MAG: GAF domain-containing protein [Terriglobia bacterium]
MSAQLTAGIAKVVGAMVKDKTELDLATANQVAGALAKNFKVKPDEVAILRLGGNGKHLEFVVPEKLSKIGSLPLSSTNALSVRTVRDRKVEFINKFSAAVHPTVFEAVKFSKQGSDPIQKIISVPIVAEGQGVGVIQISRKGKTAGAAGPDFGPKDVQELTQVATALAACLRPGS